MAFRESNLVAYSTSYRILDVSYAHVSKCDIVYSLLYLMPGSEHTLEK